MNCEHAARFLVGILCRRRYRKTSHIHPIEAASAKVNISYRRSSIMERIFNVHIRIDTDGREWMAEIEQAFLNFKALQRRGIHDWIVSLMRGNTFAV